MEVQHKTVHSQSNIIIVTIFTNRFFIIMIMIIIITINLIRWFLFVICMNIIIIVFVIINQNHHY